MRGGTQQVLASMHF